MNQVYPKRYYTFLSLVLVLLLLSGTVIGQDRIGTYTVQQQGGPAVRAVGAGSFTSFQLGRETNGKLINGYSTPFDEFELGIVSFNGAYTGESTPGDVVMRMPFENTRMFFKLGLSNAPIMTLAGKYVGIGIVNPTSQLSLGTSLANTKLAFYDGGTTDTYGIGVQPSQLRFHVGSAGARFSFLSSQAGNELFTIKGDGSIGIGIVPADATFKLSVAGAIRAKEVKVTVTGLPDYVFSPAYRLRPLREVKDYIDQNGHLPEVPSASEVAKDGLNVGEMENILLKKIEELTLYMIELKQENEQLKKTTSQLSQENQFIKQHMDTTSKKKVGYSSN